MNFLKRLFCRHRNLQFVRNISGDEINDRGGARSLWRCADCKTAVSRDDYYHGPLVAIIEATSHLTSDELFDAAEYLRSEWAARKQRTEDIAALQKALNFWKAAYHGARQDSEAK